MLFLLQNIVDSLHARTGVPFAIALPDGGRYRAGTSEPVFTVLFHTDAALLQAFTRGHLGLLESYFDQSLDVEGDYGAALATGMLSGLDTQGKALLNVENSLHELRYSNYRMAPAKAKANARIHYGLGAEFYRLWLDDPLMMYTCAYWPEGTQTLEQAQAHKIDHVCRKIRLAPGEHFIDLGCGFGGFLFRAWEQVGAIGTGINTATEQVDWLRSEITRRGLSDTLVVREADFRAADAQYDKLVSIGVLEHAGRDQLGAAVQAHAELLKPGGLGLLHFIGHVEPHETDLFIRKHIFPGGWIPALSEVMIEMERSGLEVLDVENLRRHYALTLDEWARRFEAQWEAIRALDPRRFDERFYRIWRTYLMGCAEMFRSPVGYTHLFQIVFSKGHVSPASYPMSRAHLYDGS
jgi:cyclopropane-fatty-acyl-phospholipid synthase